MEVTVMTQQAILAGGCFWCLEAVFAEMRGVSQVQSGYIGGHAPDPSYEAVCSGTTGHAEAVRITFDEEQVSFEELLQVFFVIHDPTQLNRQGHDVGTQYRSAVFYLSDRQRDVTQRMIAQLEADHVYADGIVTQCIAASRFYPAERHHNNYYVDHPMQPYCAAVIAPKLQKFRATFAALRRAPGQEGSHE
jgi:peptide-methionine (S)-S-oxide reductase